MKINEVGKSRKVVIPKGLTVCVTADDQFDDFAGVIVSSGTPYEVFGFLVSDPVDEPTGEESPSIYLGKGAAPLFLEIGKKVDLYMRTNSGREEEIVFVQEFK